MVHCSQRGSEIIAGDLSHTFLFEQGIKKIFFYNTYMI